MAYKHELYKVEGGSMSNENIRITSMKDVYELLLEQGYNVTINHDCSFISVDHDCSFISVDEEDFTVCVDQYISKKIFNLL